MSEGLVLSLFPGIGLLDMAFEAEGFCVVRGPDLLWGGDVRSFHPPAGQFYGVIGGPPCQSHSRYKHINKAAGNSMAEDLVPEFIRCVQEAQPQWFLMENVPDVPGVNIPGYAVSRHLLDNRWLGEPQARRRMFQHGSKGRAGLQIDFVVFDSSVVETTCLASEGRAGRILRRSTEGQQAAVYTPRRSWPHFCGLQGLPADFLTGAPFTMGGKYQVVGNGVPLPMGRAIARAVKQAIQQEALSLQPREPSRATPSPEATP